MWISCFLDSCIFMCLPEHENFTTEREKKNNANEDQSEDNLYGSNNFSSK